MIRVAYRLHAHRSAGTSDHIKTPSRSLTGAMAQPPPDVDGALAPVDVTPVPELRGLLIFVGVGTGVAGNTSDGDTHAPCGQSPSATQAKRANSPALHDLPVGTHCDCGHCMSRRHESPLPGPLAHTFCVPVQGEWPAQFDCGSQHWPSAAPPRQVPIAGLTGHDAPDEHVPPAQSHSRPSSLPPSHTPCAVTHAPPGQSASALHALPSSSPPEHNRPLAAAAMIETTAPSADGSTTISPSAPVAGSAVPIGSLATTFEVMTRYMPAGAFAMVTVQV